MVKKEEQNVPSRYEPIKGSELHPAEKDKLIGAADKNGEFSITIVLRRRTDGDPIPDFDFFAKTPLKKQKRLSSEEFAQKYGANPDEMKSVINYIQNSGLEVIEQHLDQRIIKAKGTVELMEKAFFVTLNIYEGEVERGKEAVMEKFRSREGYIYVPKEIKKSIIGIFGLDNRNITKRNAADPPNTHDLPIETINALYNFPTNSAAGQTIAIFSETGYKGSDINLSFNGNPPIITDVNVDASNSGYPGPETTQDIVIAAKSAPGSAIAVYFNSGTQNGWVNTLNRVAHPNAADPVCAVFSSSFYIANSDDDSHISPPFRSAVHAALQDAALQGITMCIASGDTGSESKITGGKTYVQYPGSDPYVLSVGGTTIGNVSSNSFEEWVWNDLFEGQIPVATGGGVSASFPLPSYQNNAGIPVSLNDGHIGRGVPDVAANASPNAAYTGIYVDGNPFGGNGTSASAPLWAGLIAMINSALGMNVGFVNPLIYQLGSPVFRDILPHPGAADNGVNGTPGYPAGSGWDACTGWGSPKGTLLVNGIISSLIEPNIEFWVDKSTFSKNEVIDNNTYVDAFWLVVDGINLDILGSTLPNTEKVDGCGGDASSIKPSPYGIREPRK